MKDLKQETFRIIQQELNLKYPIFAITRVNINSTEDSAAKSCVYQLFDAAIESKVILHSRTISCRGACVGCGFTDGIPDIPGGFGHFISKGRGEGFPRGERIKCCPKIAEEMLLSQPQKIMETFNAIEIEPFHEHLKPELILFFVTPDQLSGLLALFYYRTHEIDRVIVPMSSGCAQLFRIPFGETKKERPKAVLGNVDFFSRPHLDKSLLSFVVPFSSFAQMCEDAPECCFYSPAWNGVKKRL